MWNRQCFEGLKGRSRHIPHKEQLLDFSIYSWIQYGLSLGFKPHYIRLSESRSSAELWASFWRRPFSGAAVVVCWHLVSLVGRLLALRRVCRPDLAGGGSGPASPRRPPWWGFRSEQRRGSASCSPGLQLWCVAAGPPDPETGNGEIGCATKWPK